MPSSSKISISAPSGTSCVAALRAARLYDCCRRLPAMPSMRIGLFIFPPNPLSSGFSFPKELNRFVSHHRFLSFSRPLYFGPNEKKRSPEGLMNRSALLPWVEELTSGHGCGGFYFGAGRSSLARLL